MITGYYYLHQNKSLIFKRNNDGLVADLRDSNLVRMFWPFDPDDRETVWRIVVEASALGANPERIKDLEALWRLDDKDAEIYARRVGCELFLDGNQWCATGRYFQNIQESPCGFGATKREAMTELCKALGYKGGKMWAATFMDLLNRREIGQFGVGA